MAVESLRLVVAAAAVVAEAKPSEATPVASLQEQAAESLAELLARQVPTPHSAVAVEVLTALAVVLFGEGLGAARGLQR